jgi:hypothetical protein
MNDFYVESVPAKYMIFPHQNKERLFMEALTDGYHVTEKPGPGVLFCLTDYDVTSRRRRLERMREQGVQRFFVYPHAARPAVINDIHTPWENTTAQFVPSEGQIEIMRRFGYDKPLHAVGWHLCPILPFRRRKPEKVLFAPVHPRMSYVDKQLNHETFEKLYPLAHAGKIDLTVRYIHSLPNSGLSQMKGVRYVRGDQDTSFKMIDEADVVIAHQTYAYLAIARGVPTVMFGEDTPPHDFKGEDVRYSPSWEKYKDLLMYPFDLLATGDAMKLIEHACAYDREIADWRDRLIGKPFDPELFLNTVRSYL